MVLFDADCYDIAANFAARKIFPEELTEELRPGAPYFFMQKMEALKEEAKAQTAEKSRFYGNQ